MGTVALLSVLIEIHAVFQGDGLPCGSLAIILWLMLGNNSPRT
jgi:hypothetical protein